MKTSTVNSRYAEAVERINVRSEAHRSNEITKKGEVIVIQDPDFFGSATGRVKEYTVSPNADERVISYSDALVKPYIDNIDQINIMLTNACNLNCSYCHEQHRKDFGTWTLEKVHQAYQFLHKHSRNPQLRSLQFFGGEPLIHRKLIMEYLETYKEELSANKENCVVSVITNGLLLDQSFIDEFFSYDFTWLTVSLDTFDAENDHREITPKQMERIRKALGMIKEAMPKDKARKYLTIRTTLSRETAPTFREFVDELATYGVQDMIVHPLTMSNYLGYIEWSDEEWARLLEDLKYAVEVHGMEIQFTEGVAQKGSTANCLVGNQMISVDGTGDYSGCYFFTNLKNAAQPFILGNIFEDRFYIDRYEHFQNVYDSSFTKHEKCQTCEMQNYCFQCPAGHADIGRKDLITPDSMCQKIVQLYLDLKKHRRVLVYRKRFESIVNTFKANPEQMDADIKKAVQILAFRKVHGHWPIGEFVVDENKPLHESLAVWFNHDLDSTWTLSKAYSVLFPKDDNLGLGRGNIPDASNLGYWIPRNAMCLAALHFI